MKPINMPDKKGIFWAKSHGYNWWNLIIVVYGESPYFRVDIWDYVGGTLVQEAQLSDIDEVGPKIADEAPALDPYRK